MKKLTRTKAETVQEHRKLWKRIAKDSLAAKLELSGVINNCYFCHYTVERREGRVILDNGWLYYPRRIDCKRFCPGLWKDAAGRILSKCVCFGSSYYLWAFCSSDKAKDYALEVANIEIRREKKDD